MLEARRCVVKCKRDFKKREKVTKASNFQLEHLNNISQNTEGHPIKTKILYFVVFYFTEIKNKQTKKTSKVINSITHTSLFWKHVPLPTKNLLVWLENWWH